MIYSEALKALYGTVDAAKLFYDSLVAFLVGELKFKTNPYDQCVVNKDINGSQCTIIWHVDDLKISHINEHVVTSIIDKLDKKYREHDKVTKAYDTVILNQARCSYFGKQDHTG